MAIPKIMNTALIPTKDVPQDEQFLGLRIIHADSDPAAEKAFNANLYEVQSDLRVNRVWGTLALKGARKGPDGSLGYRLIFTPANPSLREFCRLVKYDPANPPRDDYDAQDMVAAHEQTQSDFKGAKKSNLMDFRNYLSEGMRGERIVYLPPVAAWQSHTHFDQTVFVAVHQPAPGSYYGQIFLPDKPIMQADGQTQTGALFALDATGLAQQEREHFFTSLEIELKVFPKSAAQSFVDRNGRGTKKNKNLVANLNSVQGLPTLREGAVDGTIFGRRPDAPQGRLHDGRNSGTGETATENIIDLSTLEQLCLNVISGGNSKPEHIKGYHVTSLQPFAKDFLEMLERVFGAAWPAKTPDGGDPYRRIYVHGWPFALKAISLAYFASREKEIAPYYEAIKVQDQHDATEETEETYLKRVAEKQAAWSSKPDPAVSAGELERRLKAIDWHRNKKHWINITGHPVTETGAPKTKRLNDGTEIVVGNAPNTAAVISVVKNKILSDTWTDLTEADEFPAPTP